VCGPQDANYDEARSVWNAQIDRRPAAVAYCLDAADVSTAIGWARAEGIGITVRGGAHAAARFAVWDGELMVNPGALQRGAGRPGGAHRTGGRRSVARQLDAATPGTRAGRAAGRGQSTPASAG